MGSPDSLAAGSRGAHESSQPAGEKRKPAPQWLNGRAAFPSESLGGRDALEAHDGKGRVKEVQRTTRENGNKLPLGTPQLGSSASWELQEIVGHLLAKEASVLDRTAAVRAGGGDPKPAQPCSPSPAL